jgi:hypothetical protein
MYETTFYKNVFQNPFSKNNEITDFCNVTPYSLLQNYTMLHPGSL